MELLENRILKDGKVFPGNILKVDSFLNHQIDVELQVLDREISRAESSGSAKKYRQLLMIQKNLQRKRQQIHFGIAKSGKRIPISSTAGLRERE